jgi:hypothetical protein
MIVNRRFATEGQFGLQLHCEQKSKKSISLESALEGFYCAIPFQSAAKLT